MAAKDKTTTAGVISTTSSTLQGIRGETKSLSFFWSLICRGRKYKQNKKGQLWLLKLSDGSAGACMRSAIIQYLVAVKTFNNEFNFTSPSVMHFGE